MTSPLRILRILSLVLGILSTAIQSSQASGLDEWDGGRQTSPSVIDMLPGTSQPAQQSHLVANLDGVLLNCFVKPGQSVCTGDLLALLDNRIAVAAMELASSESARTSDIDLAKIRVRTAKQYLARIREAHRSQAASELELERALGEVEIRRAELERAIETQEIAVARVQLEKARVDAHEIRAPFDGTIIRVDTQLGERTATGKNLILLANHDELHIEMFVPAAYFDTFQVGGTYSIWAEAPVLQVIDATLLNHESAIDPATATFRCLFAVDNSTRALPAGFTARLCVPSAN